MSGVNPHHSKKTLEDIWEEVPVDYYQRGISRNFFQRRWHQGRLKAVLDVLSSHEPLKRKIKVLDIGCASGWFLSEIASYYPKPHYVGLDVYKNAIVYAKKRYPKISFLVGDAHSLPFARNAFDLVLCTNVLEHVVAPKKIMEEVAKIVRPGAVVLIGMDSENLLFNIIWYVWKKLSGKVWEDAHLHSFNPDKLEELFEETGFTIAKRKYFHFGMAVLFVLTKNSKKV